MAKKYQHRTHVSVRRKKEEEQKLAKQRAFYAKYRKHIIIGIAALVLVIVLGSLAWDYFYAPGGSMKIFMGNLIGAEENAIIKDLGTYSAPRYYTLGKMDKPEGYEDADYGITSTAVTHDQSRYMKTADTGRLIESVYVAGVANRTGAEMMEVLAANQMYAYATEARTAEIGGHPVTYIYAHGTANSDANTPYYANLVCYVDTIQNSSVLVNLVSFYGDKDTLPTEEAMLAEAEAIFPCLTVSK